MRQRLLASLALGSATVMGTLAIAAAAGAAEGPRDKACPAAPSGFVEASVRPLGSAVPAAGEDLLWDLRVAGFAAEGLTVEEGAALFGFATVQELYDFSLASFHRDDKDGNGELCVNLNNYAPGLPAYAILRIDDRAATPNAQ